MKERHVSKDPRGWNALEEGKRGLAEKSRRPRRPARRVQAFLRMLGIEIAFSRDRNPDDQAKLAGPDPSHD